ncbi:tetratricopeptide repeat protein [Candidatus Sumerlaeota bacterium]|nr:tetratricopeptide repeat protein [Candidatus Sumerlaeota bacterium]
MRPPISIRKAHLAAVLLGALALSASPTRQRCRAQQAPPALRQEESVEKRAKDFLDLVQFGDLLAQCGLEEYALPFYSKPLSESENFPLTDVRLRVEAQSAIFALKKKCDAAIGIPPEEAMRFGLTVLAPNETQVLTSIRSGVTASDDPEARCVGRIASVYGFLTVRESATVSAELDTAYRDAQLVNLRRVGDVLLVKAYADFFAGRYSTADESARAAQQAYSQFGDFLSQAEALLFRAKFQRAVGNLAAASLREQEAANVFRDPTASPISYPQKASASASSLLTGHAEAADRHEYRSAMNQILSLLVAKRHGTDADDKPRRASSGRIGEAELLAYLAYYVQQQGHAAVARILLDLADEAIAEEIQPIPKARFDWITGKYWRSSGDAMMALRRLDHGAKLLERGGGAPVPDLAVGLLEERGLTLLQNGQPGPAKRSLEDALAMARKYERSREVERLNRYVEEIDKGQTDVAELTKLRQDADEKKRSEEWAALAASGPRVFHSPFVSDYSSGEVKSEAEAVATASAPGKLRRPTPSPTPYKGSSERLEILIRTEQWAKATQVLEEKIARDGESVPDLMRLGQCYFNRLKWDQAVDAFERVLKLDPSNSSARSYLDLAKSRID